MNKYDENYVISSCLDITSENEETLNVEMIYDAKELVLDFWRDEKQFAFALPVEKAKKLRDFLNYAIQD